MTEACAINIGPGEQRKRLSAGYGGLAIGLGLGVALALLGIAPLWRIAVFVPLLGGTLGMLQARRKT